MALIIEIHYIQSYPFLKNKTKYTLAAYSYLSRHHSYMGHTTYGPSPDGPALITLL